MHLWDEIGIRMAKVYIEIYVLAIRSCKLTLHIQSEVGCSPPCLIVAHHLVHSTVTPGGAGDGDGADRGGCPTTTGDDLAISGPGEVGGNWVGIKSKGVGEVFSFQQSGGLVWEEAVVGRI